MNLRLASCWVPLAFFLLGCRADQMQAEEAETDFGLPDLSCTPGALLECTCGGQPGTQECLPSGHELGPCVCDDASTSSATVSGTTASSSEDDGSSSSGNGTESTGTTGSATTTTDDTDSTGTTAGTTDTGTTDPEGTDTEATSTGTTSDPTTG